MRFTAQPDVSFRVIMVFLFYASIHQLPDEIALFTGLSLGVISRF